MMNSFTIHQKLGFQQGSSQRRRAVIMMLLPLLLLGLMGWFMVHSIDLHTTNLSAFIAKSSFPANRERNGVAVIIETRITPRTIPVALHFASVLGPAWPVVLYTLQSTWSMPSSIAFQRAVAAGQIDVRFLEPGTEFPTHHSVSLFLTRPWLWRQLESENRVLLFQTDSILCSNSNRTLEEFSMWDFIGAPISGGGGFNGGLSLRNPRLMLRIAAESGDAFERDSKGGEDAGVPGDDRYEDRWFYKMVGQKGGKIPSSDIAGQFSVETEYHEAPLGYHQVERFQLEHMDEILRHCPEVRMVDWSMRF